MPASIEFVGKNVEKAVKKACSKLKISEDEIKYDVLAFGSTGIFGLAGSKKAKIRVRLDAERPISDSDKEIPDENTQRKPEVTAPISDLEAYDQNESTEASGPSNSQDQLALGRGILQRIIDSLTTDATIRVEEGPDRILFDVVGGNSAILIGKRGQTLEAIQSLVEKAVNKNNKNRVRIRIDIAGYLETRRANLESLGNRLAEKAKRIGKPISLGQMSAADRRIIHLALKDDPDVRTQSRGDGYLKKLVIFPKRKSKAK